MPENNEKQSTIIINHNYRRDNMARSKNKQKRKRVIFKKKRDRKVQRKKTLRTSSAGTKKAVAKK
jgi:hypothetical protein